MLDREQQKLEAEHADEDMWVPSDLESDSELEEEENGEKNKEEEDDGDSGGEFSSEGAVLYLEGGGGGGQGWEVYGRGEEKRAGSRILRWPGRNGEKIRNMA